MKAKPMFLAVAGLFIAAGVSAQSAPAPANQVQGKPQHAAQLDKDGDGAISRKEAGAKKRFAAHFDALDGNKDGKLNKEEIQAGRKRMHDDHAARVKAADKDGKVGPEEVHARKGKPQHKPL